MTKANQQTPDINQKGNQDVFRDETINDAPRLERATQHTIGMATGRITDELTNEEMELMAGGTRLWGLPVIGYSVFHRENS